MHVLEVLGRRVLVAANRRPVGKTVHRRNQLQEVLRSVTTQTIRSVGTKRSVGRYEAVSWSVRNRELVGTIR